MTDPIHLSLSGILDFRLCQRKYDFAHNRKLRLRGTVSDNMVSGRVVDAALTKILSGQYDYRHSIEATVYALLQEEFEGDDRREEKVQRFLKGAVNAVSKCPSDILDHSDWHVQEPAELHVTVPGPFLGTQRDGFQHMPEKQDVVVHMRPDIWRTDPDTGDIILLDFKTTENDPMDYQLWERQLPYYATYFMDQDPNRVVWFRYVCLPTQGKKVIEVNPWPFTRAAETQARTELQTIVGWMVQNHGSTIPTMSRLTCKFCDFAPVCTAIITGGDPTDVIKDRYYVRERREHVN